VTPWWSNWRTWLLTCLAAAAVISAVSLTRVGHPLSLRIEGACTHVGQKLGNDSANFTPGGHYTDEVLSPDGHPYPLLPDMTGGQVKHDGSVGWQWNCGGGDAKDTYRVRITDDATNRRTKWVTFQVKSLTPYLCHLHQRHGLWYAGISDTDTAVLRTGSTGPQVAEVQCLLRHLGFSLGSAGVDGEYGQDTQSAVIIVQQQHGLDHDGMVGSRTWHALRAESG
jgi:Putative peptidoglycan binding domain